MKINKNNLTTVPISLPITVGISLIILLSGCADMHADPKIRNPQTPKEFCAREVVDRALSCVLGCISLPVGQQKNQCHQTCDDRKDKMTDRCNALYK